MVIVLLYFKLFVMNSLILVYSIVKLIGGFIGIIEIKILIVVIKFFLVIVGIIVVRILKIIS